jgi:type IV pilus biogenesis protein CpaD/CtpE
MTNELQIDVPPGFEVLTDEAGNIKVRKREDVLLSKGISFRLTTEEHNRLRVFAETYPKSSWAQAFRSLLDQPDVQRAMTARIQSTLERAS